MAMVRAKCIDGPRAGAVVWLPEGSDAWSTSGLLGYSHYRVAGRVDDASLGRIVRLEYLGRSRSRVWPTTPVPAGRIPQQRTAPVAERQALSA